LLNPKKDHLKGPMANQNQIKSQYESPFYSISFFLEKEKIFAAKHSSIFDKVILAFERKSGIQQNFLSP